MKLTAALMFATFAGGAPLLADEVVIPVAFPPERYAAMLAQSPFALATPVAPPAAAPERGFASDWYVTGLARFEDKDFVSIKSRDLATSLSLYGVEESNGVTLVGVEWSNERGKSTVTVKKAGEIARLEFNQAELQQGGAPVSMPNPGQNPSGIRSPGQMQPVVQPVTRPVGGQIPQPMPAGAQFGTPRSAIPRPTNVPVINQAPVSQPVTGQMPVTGQAPVIGQAPVTGRTPVMQPGALPGASGNAEAAPTENRRRIRVINPQ